METFNCSLCKLNFNSLHALNIHAGIKHKDDFCYHCGTCNKEFSSRNSLKTHCVKFKHDPNISVKIVNNHSIHNSVDNSSDNSNNTVNSSVNSNNVANHSTNNINNSNNTNNTNNTNNSVDNSVNTTNITNNTITNNITVYQNIDTTSLSKFMFTLLENCLKEDSEITTREVLDQIENLFIRNNVTSDDGKTVTYKQDEVIINDDGSSLGNAIAGLAKTCKELCQQFLDVKKEKEKKLQYFLQKQQDLNTLQDISKHRDETEADNKSTLPDTQKQKYRNNFSIKSKKNNILKTRKEAKSCNGTIYFTTDMINSDALIANEASYRVRKNVFKVPFKKLANLNTNLKFLKNVITNSPSCFLKSLIDFTDWLHDIMITNGYTYDSGKKIFVSNQDNDIFFSYNELLANVECIYRTLKEDPDFYQGVQKIISNDQERYRFENFQYSII